MLLARQGRQRIGQREADRAADRVGRRRFEAHTRQGMVGAPHHRDRGIGKRVVEIEEESLRKVWHEWKLFVFGMSAFSLIAAYSELNAEGLSTTDTSIGRHNR